MLFNSYAFIFAFLPLTAALFFLIGRRSRELALRWLIVASLAFYAWWRPLNVLLIAPSILINFAVARSMQRQLQQQKPGRARALLVLGIAFNIAFLGYFKYANFFVGAANDVFGARMVLTHIVLPLGISFITFQKIAFLVDVHSRRIESFTLQDYCLFVLFFPQLIAGPIVHYREMMPQFQRAACVYDRENVTVGVTLLVFGLFKKVFLADSISPFVKTLYDQASAGGTVTFVYAWMAAIGFTFQMYFDFSGYTDMALGIARVFGVRLPPNFNSPLRSASIIEFWLRWHMTLTRFLTAYLYNPLTLWLTRRRLAKGLPGFGGRNSSVGAFVSLLLLPTILTMCISGLWHGAGYLFIIWGALHGVYLSVNHGWRVFARKLWSDKERYARLMRPVGLVLTFLAVSFSMVFFRSTTLHGAMRIIHGMFGLDGMALPGTMLARLGSIGRLLQQLGVGVEPAGLLPFDDMVGWLLVMSVIVFVCPNTQQILARYEPALGVTAKAADGVSMLRWASWRPSLAWGLVVAVVAALAVLQLSGPSEFLYWQF
jgi:alginate O-acetyltransferase complex protein AlgI